MTATARLFREALADRALTRETAAEAKQIVERAGQAVEHYKSEIAQRVAHVVVAESKGVPPKTEQKAR